MNKEAAIKWDECLNLIRKKLNDDTKFSTWFAPTVANSLRGNHLTLTVPSMFCKELYEGEFFTIFSDSLHTVFGSNLKLTYQVPVVSETKGGSIRMSGESVKSPSKLPNEGTSKKVEKVTRKAGGEESSIKSENATEPQKSDRWYMPRLNSSLSFENFCVGASNKLPWTIAESIARQPFNSNFNPFFLYGDVGVGKTHLMQAIGLHVRASSPEKRVVFLPMREFQRLYQNAYLQKEIPAFLNWFMQCDVLLFDDLQEIVSSEGTLNNALFPIFNHLQQHGKQLVFTCDRPPHELKGVEERLIDRFKWGVTEKLDRPDGPLRKKILTFKAKKNGLNLPYEVIDYIASAPLNSVREIEGIVLGIMTRAISLGREIDLELAREVLERAVTPVARKTINFDMIVETVAEKYHLNSDVLFSKSRVKDVAEARMAIMYLAQKLMNLSTGSIGRKLGRKHSTVIHAIKTISKRMEDDPSFAEFIHKIEAGV